MQPHIEEIIAEGVGAVRDTERGTFRAPACGARQLGIRTG